MFFIFILVFFSLLSIASANPIPPPPPLPDNQELLPYYGSILVLIFIFYTFIEYMIIYAFLKENMKASLKVRKKLYKAVLIINFITFPIIIMMSTIFNQGINNTIVVYIILESFPIIFETLLFILAYNFFLNRRHLRRPISKNKTLISTLSANVLTFILEIIILPIYMFLAPF